MGSPKQDDALCRQISDELGAVVLAPVYRMSPKYAFPAALDDAYAALTWLAKRDDVDVNRIAVAGASAGGGLAAQIALHARDQGEIKLAAQILVYPMLDDRTALRTDLDESGFRLWGYALESCRLVGLSRSRSRCRLKASPIAVPAPQ